MGKKRSFKIGKDIVDIPVEEVDKFLVDVPDAKEVQSFVIGKDTVDIPLEEVEVFKKDVPNAKPLNPEPFDAENVLNNIQSPAPQEQTLALGLDSILPPVVAGRDPLDPNENESFNPPPSSPEPPPAPEPPRVEVTRQQRDAITRSALKVPKDIRDNPVFGTRYIKDVSARTGINEQAVKQIYEQGVNDENKYIELKSQYDITPNDSPDKNMQLHEMGQLLINLGRYDEAIEAYKGMEKRLFDQGIAEYKPGMPPNYVDQKQVPAFIGVMNAVYGKGDMKEYERLLKIAELKGVDLSGMPMVGGGDTVQPGNEMTYMGDKMVPVGSDTESSSRLKDIADTFSTVVPGYKTSQMISHGIDKIADAVKQEYSYPWIQRAPLKSVENKIAIITGLVESAGGIAMMATPGGAAYGVPFEQATTYMPESVSRWAMPISEVVRRAYDGKPSRNAENLAVLGDFAIMAIVGAGAHYTTKGVKARNAKKAAFRDVGEAILQSIEEMPDEQVREMFEQAEKRYESTGGDQAVYVEMVQDEAKAVTEKLKSIEESMPVEPYNPEPAPESLRTVPEGVDVEYNGVIGKLERGDDGTWYFVNDEGKSTQIPVEDKFNPTEKLTELGIQVMPEISKEAVARAVADREQVGEVEYRGKKYFVSLDNPMNESPTGDLVFERTADGRLLNRFDSHPDPVFAKQRKLAIVNKYLADKSLPARSNLIEPWKETKPEQPRVELPKIEVKKPVTEPIAKPVTKTEPSTPVSAEIAPEGAVTPEVAVGRGVPESKVTVDALADVESTPATTTETAPNVEDWSKDVASTAKALETKSEDDIDYISRKENNRRENSFYEKKKGVVFKGFGGNASVVSDKFGSKYKYFTNDPDYAKSFSLEKEYLTQKGNVEKYKTDYQKEYNTNEENYIKDVLKHSGKNKTTDLSPKDFDNYNDKLKADGYDVVKIKRVEPLIPSKSYKGHSSDLRSVEVEEHLILNDKSIVKISDQPSLVQNNSASISEAYHKAKADGSNPELVSAVEKLLTPQENASTKSSSMEVVGDQAPRTTPQVAEGTAKEVQKPAKKEKPLTPAQEHKKLVRQAKMMTPVNFRQAVLQFMLSRGVSVSRADAMRYTGFGPKDFPKFSVGKNGMSMHKVWEAMKNDPDVAHLIPDDDHQFNNDFFDVLTEYSKIDDMWADLLENAKEGEWREMGFESPEAYERELLGRMEAAKEGIVYDDIPSELIDQIIKEVDQMPDEAVEQMLKDLDENAPKEPYEEGTNTTTEEVIADSEARSTKGEDLYEIAREQQERDALKSREEELAQAQKDYDKARQVLEEKRKVIDERIAEEQQQELFEAEKPENPLEADVDVTAREQALAKEKAQLEEAKQRLKDIQGKRKAEALKKIDDFEQWALNLPGIKDMSGGAKKAGIGAAEVVKGITDIVRKSVEAGFDIADAVADAIEKYKRLAPEIIEAITEDAILTRFGVNKKMFAAKNEATAKLREELGIPQDVEVTAQNKRDFSQVMENAKKLRKEGAKPKDIADRIVRDGYMVSAEEQHLLVENEIALYNERREIEKKLENIDPNKIERGEEHYKLFERLDEIQAEQGLMFAALERAGREQSLVFRMRQLAMNREYSVQAFVSNYKARTGNEPSPQQINEAERLEREIRDTEARRAELEYKAKEEEMQGIIEDLREELERERVRKKGGLTKEKQARKVELKKKFSGMFNDATNIPALLADKEFIEYAGLILEEAVNDIGAFTRKLVEELGPKIEPHAKEIFDRVNKRQYNPPYMENGRLRFDTNMLKSIVEAGVKDHKDFLAKVHEIAKEEFPDITEREVADAISGYGKTINPTLDAVTKQLNSLKRDLRLASSLEDARAGKGVLRTGYRPPEYTDEQRQVMREIREELKNYPEDEASTQKKWTTALGKIKKTLENSIRDTEARIKALEQGLPVESKERKRVLLDERAQQLKEQLEDLKKRAKELEGPKTVSDEQLVRNAIAAMERSEREYNRRTQEIRQTGKYTPTNRRVVSDPELDIARQVRDRAKEEFDLALSTTDYPAQAATQKALAAAEDRLSELENKIARSDLSYRQKAINLVDQSNPMLVAAKEKIKTQQAILKAMREASGEAERHMQELWTTRKENSIKELKRKLDEKDYTKKVRKETPLTEEMIRLKAKEDRLKFDFEVAIERARLEGRGTKEKVIDAIIEAGSLPKALNASLDLSAVGRQGSILTALHPLMGARGFVEMLRQFKSKERADQWHNNLVNSEKYIVAKRSGLFINEPMAKLAAMEELFMSRLADKIPGVAGSNRAYSAYLNFMRIEAFTSFRDMLIEKGYKGEALQKELNGYATFINDATGRGSLKFGKMNLELAAPILNAFMFSPRFASSRFRIYVRHILGGFMTPPRARIRAYRALAQYGASVYLTQQILKGAGMEVSDDILSSDFGKARNGDISYDMMSGLQQPFVLMARLYNGAYVDRRGERKKLNEGNNLTYNQLISNYLQSKASPTLSMALAAGSGKFYDGEDFELSKLPERMLVPLILQDLRRMYGEENLNVDQVNWSPAGAERAAKNLPALMLGIGVNYQPEEPDVKNAQFSPKVKELIKKHKYKPEGTNDRSYYLDDEVREITDEEMEKIEVLRAKYAGEMINQMADIDMFDGLTQKAFDRKMNHYYNKALKKAKNEVLPAGWKDRKKITDED